MSECAANSAWKFNAYRKVADNYNVAHDIIYQKKLAYGEPAIIPFYYPDASSDDREIKNLIGIGSLNGDVMFIDDINGGGGTENNRVKETIYSNDALIPYRSDNSKFYYEWVIDVSDSYVNQSYFITNIIESKTGEVILPNIIYRTDSIVVKFFILKSDESYFDDATTGKLKPDVFRAIVMAPCTNQDSSTSDYEQILRMIAELRRVNARQDVEINDNTTDIVTIDNGSLESDIDEMFDENQNEEEDGE